MLSGHHEAPLYSLLALAGLFSYVLVGRAADSKGQALEWLLLFAGVGLFTFLISAVQTLPTVEYGRDALRWVGMHDSIAYDQDLPYYLHKRFRMQPGDVIGIFVPLAGEATPFVGLTVLTLAAFGLGLWGRRPWVAFYAVLAVLALLFTFGPQTIFHGWVYSLVPLGDKARIASRAIFVFQFGVIVVAAMGLDRLQNGSRDQTHAALLSALRNTLLGFASVSVAWTLWHRELPDFSPYYSNQTVFSALIAVTLALVLHGWRIGRVTPGAFRWLIIGLLVLEAGSWQNLHVVERRDPDRARFIHRLDEPAGVIEFLKRQPRPFRFEVSREGQPVNFGAWHGLEDLGGYLASESSNMRRLSARLEWSGVADVLNTVYTVSREQTRPDQEQVYEDESGWKVFRNPNARPRAWLEDTLSNIAVDDQSVDPGARPTRCDADESVAVTHPSDGRTVVDVRLECPAALVLAEFLTPGWEAWEGGRQLEVLLAYDSLRAVLLSAGRYKVEFVYSPRSVLFGALLSGLGIIACIVLAVLASKRSVHSRRKVQVEAVSGRS